MVVEAKHINLLTDIVHPFGQSLQWMATKPSSHVSFSYCKGSTLCIHHMAQPDLAKTFSPFPAISTKQYFHIFITKPTVFFQLHATCFQHAHPFFLLKPINKTLNVTTYIFYSTSQIICAIWLYNINLTYIRPFDTTLTSKP